MADQTLPPAIFIMGPTASGKTALAMALVDALPCEIISVDSALVYKTMDIGTAKPSLEERKRYPHYLVDIIDPLETYSAAQFRDDALRLMADITRRGKIPLLVGGTMLYFKALLEGLSVLPEADPVIREAIEAEAAKHGWAYLHTQLQNIDPAAAARIHPNDPQRLSRALEIYQLTGKTMTELWQQQQNRALPYQTTQIALAPADRAILHARIDVRFRQMLQQGFEEEVRALFKRGDLDPSMPSIRAVGYRQMWEYLEGQVEYNTMVEKGIAATRQLAKRQITWLRSWKDLNWIYTDKRDEELTSAEVVAKLSDQSLQIVKKDLSGPF